MRLLNRIENDPLFAPHLGNVHHFSSSGTDRVLGAVTAISLPHTFRVQRSVAERAFQSRHGVDTLSWTDGRLASVLCLPSPALRLSEAFLWADEMLPPRQTTQMEHQRHGSRPVQYCSGEHRYGSVRSLDQGGQAHFH